MSVELLLASVAVFTWTQVDSEVLSHLMYNIIVMASASTVLFNANPLMKFDGYYILSDLLQIPNLYTRAAEELQSTARRLVFGTDRSGPRPVGSQRWFLLSYGISALLWRLAVCATLLIAASAVVAWSGPIAGAFLPPASVSSETPAIWPR